MLKSTSATYLEPTFLCMKAPQSESHLGLRGLEINWTPCWNTSSLQQLLQLRGAAEKQT